MYEYEKWEDLAIDFFTNIQNYFEQINDNLYGPITSDTKNFENLLDKFTIFYNNVKFLQKKICK